MAEVTQPNPVGAKKIALLRRVRALSQAELAERCGLSRQYMNLVESGRTLPNVQIALNLADELGCSVEELFRLTRPIPKTSIEAHLVGGRFSEGSRLQVARIGGRWVGHLADTSASFSNGFGLADAVLSRVGNPGLAHALRPLSEIEHNVALAGCDPALALLQRPIPAQVGRCFWINCGSETALKLLAEGAVHAAGLHYSGAAGEANIAHIDRHDPQHRWVIFRFTRWEQGWLLRPDAKEKFKEVSDLTKKTLRLANREPGSGSRVWLDAQIAAAGVSVQQIRGYEKECRSHWECARLLEEGKADVAVGPRAVAAVFGLKFIPALQVAFDIVMPKEHLDLPRMQALLQQLRSRDLQQELTVLPGYESSEAGYLIDRTAP